MLLLISMTSVAVGLLGRDRATAVNPPLADPPQQADADKAIRERHELRIDTWKKVEYRRTESSELVVFGNLGLVSGHFDEHGMFKRFPLSTSYWMPNWKYTYAVNDPIVTGKLEAESVNFQDINTRIPGSTEEVYEFRSGKLVPGLLAYPGRFVPTAGGKIISIDEYTPKKGATRIYNLPGEFLELPKGETSKPYSTAVDKRGQLTKRKITWYRLESDTDRVVGLIQNKKVVAGKLDVNGTFIPLPDVAAVARPEGAATVEVTSGSLKMVIPVINMMPADKTVFEFHGLTSLVCGRLRPDGSFEPTLGTSVITLSDYMFYVDVTRDPIYNLPGRLVVVKE